jgi:hypothetical protein
MLAEDDEINSLVFRDGESAEKSTFDDCGTLTIRKTKSSWIGRMFGEERKMEFNQLIVIIYHSLVPRSPAESRFNIIGLEAIERYVTYGNNYDAAVDIFFDHMRRINTKLRSIQYVLGQALKEQGLLIKPAAPNENKKDGGGQSNKDQNNNKDQNQNKDKDKDKGNQNQNQNPQKDKDQNGKDNKEKEKGNQNQPPKPPTKQPATLKELARTQVSVELGGGQTANIGDLIETINKGAETQNDEDD